jgi:hypothetical protein
MNDSMKKSIDDLARKKTPDDSTRKQTHPNSLPAQRPPTAAVGEQTWARLRRLEAQSRLLDLVYRIIALAVITAIIVTLVVYGWEIMFPAVR